MRQPWQGVCFGVFAVIAITVCATPAQAQQGPACQTPAVLNRIVDLEKRIARYEKRLADARAELVQRRNVLFEAKAKLEKATSGEEAKAYGIRVKGAQSAVDEQDKAVTRFEIMLSDFRSELARLKALPPCPPPETPQQATPADKPDTPEPPRSRSRFYPTLAGFTPGWNILVGGNLALASSRNDYENAAFSGSGAGAGGQVALRYYLDANRWVGFETGFTAHNIKGHHPDGAFANYNWQAWQMVQSGYTWVPDAVGLPVNAYGGLGVVQGGIVAGVDIGLFRESMSGTQTGFTARAGLEISLWNDVWLGGAYQYSHFDGRIDNEPVKADIHMGLVTLNYRLPYGPQTTPSRPQETSGQPQKYFLTFDSGFTGTGFTFGDGFKIRHDTTMLGLRGGADWALAGRWTWGLMGSFYVPLGEQTKQGLTASLNWLGTAEVKVATPLNDSGNWKLWGSAGLIFGETTVKSSSFSESVTAGGWTLAIGPNWEFAPGYQLGATYRHIHLGAKDIAPLHTNVKVDSNAVLLSLQKNFFP